MVARLKSTLTKYNKVQRGGYEVNDYTSLNLTDIRVFINNLPKTYFDYYQIQNNDSWDRISLELYGNTDYWDILLVMNYRATLNGLPFDFDTIAVLSEDKVLEYQLATGLIFSSNTPEFIKMQSVYQADLDIINENNRVIKIIKPGLMNNFLQSGYDQGLF